MIIMILFLGQYCFARKIKFYFFLLFHRKNNDSYQRVLPRNYTILCFFGTFLTILRFFWISKHLSPQLLIFQKIKTLFFPLEEASRVSKSTFKIVLSWCVSPLFPFLVFFQKNMFQPNIALTEIIEIMKNKQNIVTVLCKHADFESLKSRNVHIFLLLQPILLYKKRSEMWYPLTLCCTSSVISTCPNSTNRNKFAENYRKCYVNGEVSSRKI